jgi:hypothetical protein
VLAVDDTFRFLVGTWVVERRFEDHRSGTTGWFRGTATLTERSPGEEPASVRGPPPVRAHYREWGQLSFGDSHGPARRLLEYRRIDTTTVAVTFPDGRPFVHLDLASGAWHGCHPCGEDRHQLAMVVRSPDIVQERWQVRGPETDYDAITVLRRGG